MRPKSVLPVCIAAASAACFWAAPTTGFAHGFAGPRFFPATIATDDPFVADELSLPTFSTIKVPGDSGGQEIRQFNFSTDISKRITPRLAVSLGEQFTRLEPPEGGSLNGFQNLELGLKYQFWENDEHEAILSAGLGAEVGGTGREAVGAESASTLSPMLFFGKGLGDLPDRVWFLRPLALTGQAGLAIPTSASPDVLQYGFALEYSLIYLQGHVKDIGLRAPFNRLIPLVEFALETPLNRGEAGLTTATINPGIIWAGKYFQLGLEAIVPANERTGQSVGMVFQLHFFLDDLFPKSLGRPLFGS